MSDSAPASTRCRREKEELAARLERSADTAWELRESEERYRSLIDAQGDLVVHRDAGGRVTFVNPAFLKAFAAEAPDVVGKPLSLAPIEEARQRDRDAPAGDVEARDLKLMTRTGPRWFAWVDIRIRDDAGALGPVYSVARDITARKEVELALVEARKKAEAASQAKSRFLATVSHEFRTPLNGILGLTGLLLETRLTPVQETYAQGIRSSGDALLGLIDDMLDFSKIEAGRFDLRPESTDLEALLHEIVELLSSRAHAKGIDIVADLDPAIPALVSVDTTRLRQVLVNLVGNAVKFTGRGGVTLAAGVEQIEDGMATVAFSVTDSGPGIAPEDSERLFERVRAGRLRAEPPARRRRPGAGDQPADRSPHGQRSHPGAARKRRLGLSLPPRPAGRGAGSPVGPEPPRPSRSSGDAGGSGTAGPRPRAGGRRRRGARGCHRQRRRGACRRGGGRALPYDAVLVDRRVVSDAVGGAGADSRGGGPARRGRRADRARRTPRDRRPAPGRLRCLSGPADQAVVAGQNRRRTGRSAGQLPHRSGGCPDSPAEIAATGVADARRAARRRQRDQRPPRPRRGRRPRPFGHRGPGRRGGGGGGDLAAGRPFAAILMDLHMPGLDGLAAARAIRAHEAETGGPAAAIVALTADVLPETRAAARAAGIDSILDKPVSPDSLRRLLAELTETRRTR